MKTKKIIVAVGTALMAVIFIFTLARAMGFSTTDDVTDSGILPPSYSTSSTAITEAPTGTTTTNTNSPSVPGEKPVKLVIPSLNINAKVQYVGIGKSGNMAVPYGYTDVGWYRYGPLPGQIGSAVFDGHVDNGLGVAAVFKHVGDIKIGDEIDVITEKGNKIPFKVTDVAQYGYKDKTANQKIFIENKDALIRLITCTGTWVSNEKTYDHRIVVTGKLAI